MCSVASLYLVILVLLTVIDTMFALFEAGSQVVGACPSPRFGYASRGANRVAPLRGAASPGANRVAPLRGAVATWVIPGTTSERLNMVSPMQGA